MDYENVCGICGDIIEKTNDEKLINTKLKCGHNFHYMCIEYSYKFSKSTKCPYCRQDGGKLLNLSLLCPSIIKSGINKGNRCNCKLKPGFNFCGRHLKK